MGRKLSPGIHNIRIKKPGGGTRMQRVRVLKSGKFKFIKNVKGGAKPKAKKPAAKPQGKAKGTSPGRRNTMARRKSSLPNRLINAALLALFFARPLTILFENIGSFGQLGQIFADEATAGAASGSFDPGRLAVFYGPMVASLALFELKKVAMKKFKF